MDVFFNNIMRWSDSDVHALLMLQFEKEVTA